MDQNRPISDHLVQLRAVAKAQKRRRNKLSSQTGETALGSEDLCASNPWTHLSPVCSYCRVRNLSSNLSTAEGDKPSAAARMVSGQADLRIFHGLDRYLGCIPCDPPSSPAAHNDGTSRHCFLFRCFAEGCDRGRTSGRRKGRCGDAGNGDVGDGRL
ncbi:hypothetical protein D3C81_1273070 [compost metagenome]